MRVAELCFESVGPLAVPIYTYIYIYTYIHTYIHTYTHTYIYSRVRQNSFQANTNDTTTRRKSRAKLVRPLSGCRPTTLHYLTTHAAIDPCTLTRRWEDSLSDAARKVGGGGPVATTIHRLRKELSMARQSPEGDAALQAVSDAGTTRMF